METENRQEEFKPSFKRKAIDKDMVYRMACLMCSYDEIGGVFGVTGTAIQKKYKKIVELGRAAGKKSLRKAQWEKALAGDTRLLMFLGKNYLGQSDNGEQTEDNKPLPWDEEA
jgi:hypothetical protein